MKSTSVALALAALLSSAAFAVEPPPAPKAKSAKAKAAKTSRVCGTLRVDRVQCIRAPCPPLVFLTVDGGTKQYSITHAAGADPASTPLLHGAHVCVTGHLIGQRMDSLQVKAVKPR